MPGTGAGGRRRPPRRARVPLLPRLLQEQRPTRWPASRAAAPTACSATSSTPTRRCSSSHSGQMWLLPGFDAARLPSEGIRSIITDIGLAASVPAQRDRVPRPQDARVPDEQRRPARRPVGPGVVVGLRERRARSRPTYQRTFGNGLTKTLVAAKGTKASARTIGLMALAFIYCRDGADIPHVASQSGYGAADRLLDAPDERGVDRPLGRAPPQPRRALRPRLRRPALQVDGGRITGATLADGAGQPPRGPRRPLRRRDARRAGPGALRRPRARRRARARRDLDALEYDYMNGIQFFLNRMPAEPVEGHVAYLAARGRSRRSTRACSGPGPRRDLRRRPPARHPLGRHLGLLHPRDPLRQGRRRLHRRRDRRRVLGPAQGRPQQSATTPSSATTCSSTGSSTPRSSSSRAGRRRSTEPLLINTAGRARQPPNATTSIPNLFLAADYVRCDVDLATMEGANEAGRQAANAILDAAGSTALACRSARCGRRPSGT